MQKITIGKIVNSRNIPLRRDSCIAEALYIMTQHEVSSVVIVDDEHHPVGIFTEHDALDVAAQHLQTSLALYEVMSENLFCIHESMHLYNAYILLENRGYRHLVVVDERDKYVGVVSEGDFLRQVGSEYIANSKEVRSVMSRPPIQVADTMLVTQVAKIMHSQGAHCAIVIRDDQSKMLLEERDISYYCVSESFSHLTAVRELKQKSFESIPQSMSLKKAAIMMERHDVHQFVVMDDNQAIVGLLKRNNVLKAIHGEYFNFLVDIIDRKSADLMRIYENKKLLRDVINTIPDLIWLKDSDGKFLTCNNRFECFYNAQESTIVGKTDFDLMDAPIAAYNKEQDQMVLGQATSIQYKEHLVFADGSYEGLFHIIKTPMRNDHDEVIGVLSVARDITELHRHETTLRRIDHDFNEAQALAHIGSWSLEPSKALLQWSDECYRIFNIEIGTPVDYKRFLQSVHPDDREQVDGAWQAALQGAPYKIDHRIVINNTIKWVRERAKLEFDDSGQVKSAVGTVQDITKRKLYEEELERLVNYDSLTGLANRSFLLSHLQKSIHMAMRNHRTIALLLFDLDHFKDVNDSFGHAIGDELLTLVAKRFIQRIRKGDLITRLGGDEFAVVLEHITRREDAAQVAQEMMEVLAKPYRLSNRLEVHIGSSVGIVIAPQHSNNAEELLQFADTALYKAKSEGRSTYSYYTDELTSTARERMHCENRLRHAISNEEFELYYQPQVHMQSNRIIGVEALLRWNDPESGIISPDRFIPLAEETGMIGEIGKWVLFEACRQGKEWIDQGYNLHVSVNVSAHQVHHQDLPKVLDAALKTSGFNAEKLTLELTESAMMRREEEVVTMLHVLRAKGIRLAIDDFGTGYSSYSYLKRFPIDILKIDKSFIDDVPYENDDVAIVKAIIAMGSAMGYQILAEGIEKIEQLEFLKEQGCSYYKGYFKSKPLCPAEFERLLKEHS